MASPPPNYMPLVIGTVVAGVAGVAFMGSQQSARNQQNQIDRLPALENRVSTLESVGAQNRSTINGLNRSISEIQRIQAEQLDREALADAFSAIEASILALEEQLNRRINLEVKTPIYAEIQNIKNATGILRSDNEDNENKIAALAAVVSGLEAIVNIIGPR